MQLTKQDIARITKGALRVEENAEGEIALLRFTEEQFALYESVNKDFYRKAYGTAGVRLEMDTDAESIKLSYTTKYASSRRFYYVDVFVDGVMVQHIGHDNVEEVKSTFTVELPEGTHRVCIYLPNLTELRIRALVLSDGATFTPVQRPLKLLCYGDSITQGYDAEFASQSYVNLLADKLGAEVVNQGIGGEIFRPELVTPLGYDPDIITVAYGTNDWSGQTAERTEEAANGFFKKLRALYPNAKLFAITPIWRADDHRITKGGTFEEGRARVRNAALANGITVIEGDGMIPHLREVCSDRYLHPNDYGFKFYANALYSALVPYLKEV